MTTKLLMVGDAGNPTGFAKVVQNVCAGLHATGKYEIVIRGLGYDPEQAKLKYPVEVKTVGATHGDPLGVLNFGEWIEEDKPDVVWTVQDLWNILGYCLKKPIDLPMVAYFPVDTPNMSFGNAWALGAVTEAVAYTQFGAHETAAGLRMAVDVLAKRNPEAALQPREWLFSTKFDMKLFGRLDRHARYQNPKNYNIIPHGLDLGVYAPRDKQQCRRALKLPEKGFIVTYVGTNQFRKRQDLAIRAFARFQREHPEAYLILHCAHDNGANWDLAQLAHLYGVRDRVILTHQTVGQLSEDDLCSLYNAADVNINTSGGEGWGLPLFESAACGVPQVVPDWSATRELWQEHGVLVDVADYRIEPRMGINTAHAVVSTENLADRLSAFYRNPTATAEWGAKALAHARNQPTWGTVANGFDQIIQNARHEPAPREYSLAQVQALREGVVECEIANWL